jgi:hypothetical protein
MATLYIVAGETGEYEDMVGWTVVAYLSYRFAKMHARRAQKCADEIFAQHGGSYLYGDPKDKERYNEFDPRMRLDGGARYGVMTLELRDGLPTSETPMRRFRKAR